MRPLANTDSIGEKEQESMAKIPVVMDRKNKGPAVRTLYRLCVALLLILAIGTSTPLSATGNGRGQKTVHVKEYTKKDGTTVEAHDRKAPSPKAEKEDKAEAPKQPAAAAPASSSSVKRDANGRIERSQSAKHQFEAQSGYSHGRPGYVVDHIKPLACGGADTPANMQWQTIEEAKAKDKWERNGC
jgi:hypothetical protein